MPNRMAPRNNNGDDQRPVRRLAQASSRKGCMRGKGGPENAACTYKGVRQRTWGKWVAETREPNRGSRVWLGTFETAYAAAVAYDNAARKLYGAEAKVNLPHLCHQPDENHSHHHHRQANNVQTMNLFDTSSSSSSSSSSFLGFRGGEYVSSSGILNGLNVNLPAVDDSHLWEEAAKDTSFHIVHEATSAALESGKDGNGIKFPWDY